MRNARILVISDQHFPFNHPDCIRFLRHLKKKYRPDRVINIGDELDYHAISFHEHNPDLPGPSDELERAVKRISCLYELFPEMDLIDSNHGSLVFRKAKNAGLPTHVLKSYREIIGAPRTWKWHFDLTLKMSNGQYCYFHHGKIKNGLKLSQSMGMCVVQGHFHTEFNVQYWGNPLGLYWSMAVGCLIDNKSLAFEYNKTTMNRPIIGTGLIINGQPVLEPMILNAKGRWIGA